MKTHQYRLIIWPGDRKEHRFPLRDTWGEAAKDAHTHGVGRWKTAHEFTLDHPHQIKGERRDPATV